MIKKKRIGKYGVSPKKERTLGGVTYMSKLEMQYRAKTFSDYERFSKQVEKLGWVYSDPFVKFYASATLFNDCLYFSCKFDNSKGNNPKYRFSNVDEGDSLIFNISNSANAFKGAIDFATTQIEKCQEK